MPRKKSVAKSVANPERMRLEQDRMREKNWKRWGPYLSERQWGTVREDYSESGDAWTYFPHDHARSRTYRWGEDGLLGFTDRECRLCFGLALWNEADPFLKERLYGLSGPEGNHGEDVKELYYYLESTPTHSYVKSLYKYPYGEFPYEWLKEQNAQRGLEEPEYEILDSGVFDDNRYFDVFAEYAKEGPNDLLIRITVANRGEEGRSLHVLPTLWYRNTWAWGCEHEGCTLKPTMKKMEEGHVVTEHETLGKFHFWAENAPDFLFTENESNTELLYDSPSYTQYTKDAFHRYVVNGEIGAIEPGHGTKAAPHYRVYLAAGETKTIQLRLSHEDEAPKEPFGKGFDQVFEKRIAEADSFYNDITSHTLCPSQLKVLRQCYAGLLQTKQFYHYSVRDWLRGDPGEPAPPEQRKSGRNSDWGHLFNRDVISMPDKWEYPWFAAWDLAFHMIPFDKIDPDFAKQQMVLFLREWYMHPNGQIPAYEWNFSDVNPPVHAWACWRLYKMTGHRGERDRDFLAQCFHKLLINFTWWVNRKDPEGRNLFAGGFLGLDNIGAFDRSKPLPGGAQLVQADGTAWMAFYCATMLSIALELAAEDPSYEGVASKFFEHFVSIGEAINTLGGGGLWNEEDGFYYDMLHTGDGQGIPMAIRSMVGLLPICAVEILKGETIDRLPGFKKRMQWFLDHNDIFLEKTSCLEFGGGEGKEARALLGITSRDRLERVLRYLFDENEFLSPYGIRSLSKAHENEPFVLDFGGEQHSVKYEPGESQSYLFGGNSNWRGPIWFPVNFLIIEVLEKYHHFYGDSLKVELPTGSGNWVTLDKAAEDLSRRLTALFLPDDKGDRPVNGQHRDWYRNEHFKEHVLFYEYFHGDDGRGCGASHQTGWTGLVAKLLEDRCHLNEG
ncbi:MAG: glucosidase [Verrucomicrobiota bacterium]